MQEKKGQEMHLPGKSLRFFASKFYFWMWQGWEIKSQ